MQGTKITNCGGFSVFEQAIVLVVLITAILGAADLMHLLHAYSTMQAAVQEALRCAAALDSCQIIDSTAPSRLYRISRLEHQDSEYYVNGFNYRADSSWFRFDSYSYQTLATVPSEVQLTYDRSNYSAERPLYPAIAYPNYFVRTAGLPQIVGNSYDNVQVRYPGNPNRDFPAALDRNISTIRLADQSAAASNREEIIRFRLETPANGNNAPCYVSQNEGVPRATQPADFSKECDQNWPWRDGQVFENRHANERNTFRAPLESQELTQFSYIVLHLEGDASGSSGSQGELAIFIAAEPSDPNRAPQWRALNGRMLSSTSSGNLLPRGAPAQNYSAALRQQFYDPDQKRGEIYIHQAIRIPYGRPILLRLVLTRSSGQALRWQGRRLRVFTPQYRLENAPFECDNKLTKTEASLALPPCQSVVKQKAITRVSADLGRESFDGPALSLGCQDDQIAAREKLTQLVTQPADYDLIAAPARVCGTAQKKYRCPPAGSRANQSSKINFGVPACHDLVAKEQRQLLAICPAPAELAAVAASAQVSCREEKMAVSSKIEPNWRFKPSSCLDLNDSASKQTAIRRDLPADLKPFLKLDFVDEQGDKSVFYDYYPFAAANDDQKSEQPTLDRIKGWPELNCPAAKLAQLTLYKGVANLTVAGEPLDQLTLPASSPFSERQPDLGCNWQTTLRNAAQLHGAALSSHLLFFGDEKTPEVKAVPFGEIDDCTSYQINRPKTARKIVIGTFAEDQIPQEYHGADYVHDLIGFDRAGPVDPQLDQELAKQLGIRLIRATFPQADFSCQNGRYCTKIEIEQVEKEVRAAATMQLPIRLFFQREIALSFRQAKAAEISLH